MTMILLSILHNTIQPLRHVKTFQIINLNVTRKYARWVSRRPVAIVNKNELYECEDTSESQELQRTEISRRRPRKMKSSVQTKTKEIKDTEENKRPSTKIKDVDKVVKALMSKLRSQKRRDKNNEIILEGYRLIKDALDAGVVPKVVLFNNPSDIRTLKLPEEVALYKVPYKTVQLWSSLTTSPGLLGVFNAPDVHKNTPVKNALPLTIICDNIREPGNLGSILRAAAGVGCERLILMKGCVDLWDPKVLRSAAGTHFRLPIYTSGKWDEISSLISEDCHIFVADSTFGDEFIKHYSSDELESSLQIFDISPKDLKSNINTNKMEKDKELSVPTNKKMMRRFMLNFPIIPYHSLNYTEKECVIILSGETEGLSLDSYKILSERKFIRINIPLVQGVDSLNTGVALGIVTFEIKRQFLKKKSEL